MNLYCLTAEIRAAMRTDDSGELSSEQLTALDQLTPDYEQKVRAYLALIRERKATAFAAHTESARFADLAATEERNAKTLSDRLQASLEQLGLARYDLPDGQKVWIQRSPPSCRFDGDVASLPDRYKRVTVAPNITAVMDEFKATGDLPEGFDLVTDNFHLRIK